MMKYFWFYLILLVLAIIAINWLGKREYINKQFARKLTHTVTGVIACTFPVLLVPSQIWLLSGIFVVLMSISKIKRILVLNKVDRTTWGEVYFPASVGLCAFISLPHNTNAYFVGILCLTFADTSANIIGNIMPLKVIKIRNQTKSLGGFLAFVIIVFAIFSIFYPITYNSWFLILAISILIGFVEVVSIYGIDNITVPLAASLLYLMLNN